MAASAREALHQRITVLKYAIADAVEAVEKGRNLRILGWRSTRLSAAWASYEQAFTTHQQKVVEQELRDSADETRRFLRDNSDQELDRLEALIETKQKEAVRGNVEQTEGAELELARAQVKSALDEVERRLG